MSLAIREQEVVAVLLADGWHDVKPRSFFIDAYEYIHDDGSLSAGGVGFGFHAGAAVLDSGRHYPAVAGPQRRPRDPRQDSPLVPGARPADEFRSRQRSKSNEREDLEAAGAG